MKNLYLKYNQQFRYLFFGVLTTFVNYFSFWLLITLLGTHFALGANVAAFVVATAFAYLTNKCYVFKSTSWDRITVCREGVSFVGTRVFSFAFEETGLFLCIIGLPLDHWDLLGLNGTMLAKIVLSGVSVLLNYFFSKKLIFRERKGFDE
jgi:putative flippase GtrA